MKSRDIQNLVNTFQQLLMDLNAQDEQRSEGYVGKVENMISDLEADLE